jgi:hypothetical protein
MCFDVTQYEILQSIESAGSVWAHVRRQIVLYGTRVGPVPARRDVC